MFTSFANYLQYSLPNANQLPYLILPPCASEIIGPPTPSLNTKLIFCLLRCSCPSISFQFPIHFVIWYRFDLRHPSPPSDQVTSSPPVFSSGNFPFSSSNLRRSQITRSAVSYTSHQPESIQLSSEIPTPYQKPH